MGQWYRTSFAILDGNSIVSIRDALQYLSTGESLKGRLTHVQLPEVPVKFVHHNDGKVDDFFAVIGHKNLKLSAEEKKLCNEHPLHRLCKDMLMSLCGTRGTYLDFGKVKIFSEDVVSVAAERKVFEVSEDDSEYIIPDVTVTTEPGVVYYIEIVNTNGISATKKAKYRYHAQYTPEQFKVLIVDIRDLVNETYINSYSVICEELKDRLTYDLLGYKHVLELAPLKKEKEVARWGSCPVCNTPLVLVNNVNDPDKQSTGCLAPGHSVIPRISIKNGFQADEDKFTAGSAYLMCPHCSEHRVYQLLCPKCLHDHKRMSHLTLLSNSNTQVGEELIILKCADYKSGKALRKESITEAPESLEHCTFCMNVYKADGRTPTDELLTVGEFGNLYQKFPKYWKKLVELRSSAAEARKSGG